MGEEVKKALAEARRLVKQHNLKATVVVGFRPISTVEEERLH